MTSTAAHSASICDGVARSAASSARRTSMRTRASTSSSTSERESGGPTRCSRAGGSSATNVPRPARVSTRPELTSMLIASRTELRLTENCRARSRWPGSCSPATNSPDSICRRIVAAIPVGSVSRVKLTTFRATTVPNTRPARRTVSPRGEPTTLLSAARAAPNPRGVAPPAVTTGLRRVAMIWLARAARLFRAVRLVSGRCVERRAPTARPCVWRREARSVRSERSHPACGGGRLVARSDTRGRRPAGTTGLARP